MFCGTPTTREPGPDQSNIDHAIPKARGGNNTVDNAQETCRTCNLDKGTKTTEEYMQVSFEDIVFAEMSGEGDLVFTGVSIRAGHSTYRVILKVPMESSKFRERWTPLEALGCRFEGVRGTMLAIDVPPSADIYELFALLQAGADAGVWDFEEGDCGHALRDTSSTADST